MLAGNPPDYRVFPGVCPRWDNEPRRPRQGFTLFGTSPALYGRWLSAAAERQTRPQPQMSIVFINAWNEWAEGTYLEPDRHHGYAYLAETRRIADALVMGGRLRRWFLTAGRRDLRSPVPPSATLWSMPSE